jgi:hypothetical protein
MRSQRLRFRHQDPARQRNSSNRILLGAIPAIATGIVLAAAAAGPGQSGDARSAKRWKPCPPEGSKAVNFSAYYLGDAFQRHALTKTLRVCNKPHPWEPVRGNYISYIYGDCVPGSDSGCAPPVEIQSAPACERRPSRRVRRRARRHEIRGAPAVQFPGESRLELFTGDATVMIFGHTPEEVRKGAAALRSIPGSRVSVPAGARLPKPLRGASSGKLRC